MHQTQTIPEWLAVSDEVRAAVAAGGPVVALESTLIAHGLPYPVNLETARAAERACRAVGATPATIAVLGGRPTVGLSGAQLEALATLPGVRKAGRRDLGAAVALGHHAATTVSATMALAHAAGVRVFATGGLGGAHREAEPFDISADLTELARTPVLVVCSGAKSILHLPRTIEILETLGVPVVGYRTDTFPAFYVGDHAPPLPVSARVDSPGEAADLFAAHVRMGGAGAVLAQPCPADVAVPAEEFDRWLTEASREAGAAGVTGAKVTPFLLSRLAALSGGRTLAANQALIVANARLAAEVAAARSVAQ
ncbi:pseudouridine-5'-phosphate glycosidase [Gemmata sp. JC717]|uniref:pseudouridine-5'-phosphate glycosidase n=1 Tax=Gemmata algarum TaxID=2975278 RepID=UPI0021BAFD5A|nr:pseudouridine-5'-phosphate glycosidase [Gemmata algarum]MDY3556209.1 pseudouridine-5'-phosphate glycosidase [Gemmata algarum]